MPEIKRKGKHCEK